MRQLIGGEKRWRKSTAAGWTDGEREALRSAQGTATNRRIAVSVADARASARDIGASVATSLAHAALRKVTASEANVRASAASSLKRLAPPARGISMVGAMPTGAAPLPLRRSIFT